MSSEISPSSAPNEKKSAPATPSGIISTRGLAKVYGKREVVHDVSLEVRAGECVDETVIYRTKKAKPEYKLKKGDSSNWM